MTRSSTGAYLCWTDQPDGTCHIQTAPLRNAERWIGERRTTWERRFDRLGEILASEPASHSASASDSGSAAESASASPQE